jgi:hypothetical protein
MGVSLNDPFSSARDDVLNNRLQFVYNPSDPVSTLEQQYMQRMGNASDPRFSNMDVSVSLEPTSTPFPLGCPTGFYQQGNVCIPIVGTYPGDDFNAPPAGQDFARGEIEDVDLPSITVAGQTFQIRTHFKNIGAFRGKFATKITIAGISVTGSLSENGFVPGFARGIVYHNISMPANAPTAQSLEAQIELVRWDEVQNKFVTDDVGTVNIPSPGSVPPAPTTDCFTLAGVQYCVATVSGPGCIELNNKIYCPSTTSPQCKTISGVEYCKSTTWQNNCIIENGQIYCPNICKTINNKQYCKSNTWLPGCVVDSGFVYCPSDPDCKMIGNKEYCKGTTYGPGCIVENNILWCPSTTPSPNQQQAVIITNPQTRVADNTTFKILGSKFLPNKAITITLRVVWHCGDHDGGGSHYARAMMAYYGRPYRAFTGDHDDDDDDDHNGGCSYEGKTDTWTVTTSSNNDGNFLVSTKTRDVPSGVYGIVEMSATDGTPLGTATAQIENY